MASSRSTQVLTTEHKGQKIHAYSIDYEQPCDSIDKNSIFNRYGLHGLAAAISEAYSLHQHLRLKPDDIWLTIGQGVSQHINLNAERFRSFFVEHEGQKTLSIFAGDILAQSNHGLLIGDWPTAVTRLAAKTNENVQKIDLQQILECDFSTSTPAAVTASQIIILDAMKAYFRFMVCLGCGIPKVTLEGTLDDWLHLQEKVAALRNLHLDLDFWLDRLDPVITELIKTYRGEVNPEFWARVMKKERFGSGGQQKWDGWLISLFPYDIGGKKIETNKIDPSGLPLGVKKVPFFTDTGLKFKFVGGFLGARQEMLDEEVVVEPVIGWYIVDDDGDNNSSD